MLTIIGMFSIIVSASMLTACSQDDYLPEVNQIDNNAVDNLATSSEDFSVEIFKLDSDSSTVSDVKADPYTTSAWGSYPLLNKTVYTGSYFSTGTYAVQVKRKSSANDPLTIYYKARTYGSNNTAKLLTYLFDSSYNQLYSSGYIPFDNNIVIDTNISISGSNILIFVLHITTAGNYIFRFSHDQFLL